MTNNDNIKNFKNVSFVDVLYFLFPSLIGVLLLMIPFSIDGKSTVLVSVISNKIFTAINSVVPIYFLVLFCIFISFSLAFVYRFFRPSFIVNNKLLMEVSDISSFWLFVRFLGLAIGFLTIFETGPSIIYTPDTGGLILYDLICGLFTIFLVASFVLPFLTEFGFLEYVGVFLTSVMRPLFNLPGRSAIDCIASWIGDGTIGVTLTAKQYEEGNYTAREAAVISTTFSAVSITFCLVVLENVGLTDYFGKFYLTVAVSGIVAALILPRIRPLSKKSDSFVDGRLDDNSEFIPNGFSKNEWALMLAVNKAKKNFSIRNYFKNSFRTVLGLWLGVIPTIMAVGTLALVVSVATPIFTYMGKPFLPFLNFLGVAEADQVSKTMIVGFADMVVPSILIADVTNPMTRFIVAALSVSQLLYMSETGSVILGSNLPVSLWDLFVIFLERTLLSLPVIVLFANLIF